MNGSAVTITDKRTNIPSAHAGIVPEAPGTAPLPSRGEARRVPQGDRMLSGVVPIGAQVAKGTPRSSEGAAVNARTGADADKLPGELSRVLSLLAPRISRAVRDAATGSADEVSEIRLRRGACASITVGGRNVPLPLSAADDEIDSALRTLCDRSLYAKTETIREGFIPCRGGVRVGVCGRAVIRDGAIVSVAEISSLNIRIPHRVVGCADGLWEIMKAGEFARGVLVWSAPGVGKTTILRELGVRLSGGASPLRTAIVDSRAELAVDGAAPLADVLSLYPRAKGIEIARRTLSPQIVICDEIAGDEDAEAILEAHRAGITVCASAHAASFESLTATPQIAALRRAGVFGTYYGLLAQRPGGYETSVRTEDAAKR